MLDYLKMMAFCQSIYTENNEDIGLLISEYPEILAFFMSFIARNNRSIPISIGMTKILEIYVSSGLKKIPLNIGLLEYYPKLTEITVYNIFTLYAYMLGAELCPPNSIYYGIRDLQKEVIGYYNPRHIYFNAAINGSFNIYRNVSIKNSSI